jgi:hypothetical protein
MLPTPPLQTTALVQIAHTDLAIKTKTDPAFRVLGAFNTKKQALKHFKQCTKKKWSTGTLTFVVPLGETNVIPNSSERTREYLAAKADLLRNENEKKCDVHRQAFKAEFARRKKIAVGDDEGEKLLPPAEACAAPAEEEDEDDDDEAFLLDRNAEVRNQKYCAITVLVDESKEREDAFAVHGCFDRAEECQAFMRDALADHVPNQDIFCVEMYAWVYPVVAKDRAAMDRVPFSYRDETLNRLMQPKTKEIERVKRFHDDDVDDFNNGADEKK